MKFRELPYESGSWIVYVGDGFVVCPDCARYSDGSLERALVSELERPDVCDACDAVLLGPYIYGPDLVGGLAKYRRWQDYHEVDYLRGIMTENEPPTVRTGRVLWVIEDDPVARGYGYLSANELSKRRLRSVRVAVPRYAKAGDWIGVHWKCTKPNYWEFFVGRIAEVRDAEEGR